MKYIELTVVTNPLWAEYVADILINQINCSGVVTEELEYKDETITKASTDIVKGYLWLNDGNPPDIQKIQEVLTGNKNKLVNINNSDTGSWNVSIKTVDDEDWAHSWKKFWHPMKIGSKIVIAPSWENYEPQNGEIKIEIDPGTAFGTGTHPTTRLCIVALEKYVTADNTIADVGTGSGILAISGIKLGAKKIIGVDNDPSVIEVAQENARKNFVSDKCDFYEGSAADIKGDFNIVIANILAEVIVDIMDGLVPLVRKGGKLILSGIIAEKADMVRKSVMDRGLTVIETLKEEGWVAIIAGKAI